MKETKGHELGEAKVRIYIFSQWLECIVDLIWVIDLIWINCVFTPGFEKGKIMKQIAALEIVLVIDNDVINQAVSEVWPWTYQVWRGNLCAQVCIFFCL